MMDKSPLAPKSFPNLPQIAGVKMAVAQTGMKYQNRDDLLLMCFDEGTSFAGVFTKSATASAPVLASRAVADSGSIRAILVNAGNANAFTGAKGVSSVEACVSALSKTLDIPADMIATASTGVIGEPLNADEITAHFAALRHLRQQAGKKRLWPSAQQTPLRKGQPQALPSMARIV